MERWTYRILIWTKEAHIPTHQVCLLEEKLKSLLHPRSSCSGRASPDQGGWGQKRRLSAQPVTTTVTTCGRTNVFHETQRKKPYLKKCPVEDLCFCWPQFAPFFSESLSTGQPLQSRPLILPPSFRRQVRSLASPHRRRWDTLFC